MEFRGGGLSMRSPEYHNLYVSWSHMLCIPVPFYAAQQVPFVGRSEMHGKWHRRKKKVSWGLRPLQLHCILRDYCDTHSYWWSYRRSSRWEVGHASYANLHFACNMNVFGFHLISFIITATVHWIIEASSSSWEIHKVTHRTMTQLWCRSKPNRS